MERGESSALLLRAAALASAWSSDVPEGSGWRGGDSGVGGDAFELGEEMYEASADESASANGDETSVHAAAETVAASLHSTQSGGSFSTDVFASFSRVGVSSVRGQQFCQERRQRRQCP